MATPVISGVTRTNLGPLTTNTWTYTCTEVIQLCPGCDSGWAAQTCATEQLFYGPTDNQNCWPPRVTGVPSKAFILSGWGVYSPGIFCPEGFTSAAAITHGGSSDFNFQFPLTAGETGIGCCPKGGFTPFDVNGQQTCLQVNPTTTFLIGSCSTGTPTYTPFSIGGRLNSSQFNSFSVWAPMLQVVYQASDLAEENSTTLSTLSSTTSSSGNTVSPQISATNKPGGGSISGSAGLSVGTAAGIAIGSALGLIFIATVTFCICRAQRKRYAKAMSAHQPGPNTDSEASYTAEYEPPVQTDTCEPVAERKPPVEIDGTEIVELNAPSQGRGPWNYVTEVNG
ncbi:hypothetical protein HD806DRAFT_449633 [Xylariaceae sp. AK1471]|nr:hypothetical protein HD806DRAFT_449633 [Xylariaceae sp. AK1471]